MVVKNGVYCIFGTKVSGEMTVKKLLLNMRPVKYEFKFQ
jgi:hypothetical protein